MILSLVLEMLDDELRILFEQNVGDDKNRYKPSEIHEQHLRGCGIWFQHLISPPSVRTSVELARKLI